MLGVLGRYLHSLSDVLRCSKMPFYNVIGSAVMFFF
jgi:hypothetical protein